MSRAPRFAQAIVLVAAQDGTAATPEAVQTALARREPEEVDAETGCWLLWFSRAEWRVLERDGLWETEEGGLHVKAELS